jgi:anti-anti-sigma regulatory factor
MLKIECTSQAGRITVRLIGCVRSEHLDEITKQMRNGGATVSLDLEEVTVVDVQVIRFLGARETEGIELLHCPPYIREWISCEQGQY